MKFVFKLIKKIYLNIYYMKFIIYNLIVFPYNIKYKTNYLVYFIRVFPIANTPELVTSALKNA